MKKLSTHQSLVATCAMCLLPISAFAHPGGGATTGFSAGFIHPFSGADHLLAMIAVGLLAARLRGPATWIVPCALVGMMLAGSAWHVWSSSPVC